MAEQLRGGDDAVAAARDESQSAADGGQRGQCAEGVCSMKLPA